MYSVRQYRNRIEIININTTDKRWNGGVMSIFTGAGVAIVTPMKANGEINYDKLAELLDYQINNSTDAIVICGTTGESATMTEKEHIEAIRFTADYVKKRVPVVAGTGSNCTKTAVELSKEAQAAGVDGCLVVTPYYNKATQKGLIEHYTAVARSIDLPIIMYNVPSRTGCNIQPETAVKLAREVDNIVAIKAATGNLSQESKTMMLAEGCLDMYSGEDGLIVPLMSIGAKGVISVLSMLHQSRHTTYVLSSLPVILKRADSYSLRRLSLLTLYSVRLTLFRLRQLLILWVWKSDHSECLFAKWRKLTLIS